jgi:hypothetical protein
MPELKDVFEMVTKQTEPDADSWNQQERRQRRTVRNRKVGAFAVAAAIVVAAVALFVETRPGEDATIPANPSPPTSVQPGVVIDQTFVDSVNNCERPLVTQQEVQSALGFQAMDPTPYELGGTPNRLGVEDPLSTGCEYASLDVVPGLGQSVPGNDGLGGQLVITAYLADVPPSPLGRGSTLQGLGDEALYTRYGNGDEHLHAPEGATSILEVRSGDLILRFNGGSYDVAANVVVSPLTGYPLPPLRQLAEDALTTLAAVTGPRLAPGTTSRPFFLDLRTGEQTPLPESIAVGHDYVASLDGTLIAYEGIGDDGSPQIFVAQMATGWNDGSNVRQVTHDPAGATHPAWSPDGNSIGYESSQGVGALFVLDLTTGVSTQIVDEPVGGAGDLQFTPDGSSVVYSSAGSLWTAPVAGGKSTLLVGAGEGVKDAGNGSLSPDGSLVTFLGSGWPRSESFHCGPCRFVANADGTERRVIPGWTSNPAGAWSQDGSRIVCLGTKGIVVVDVATGDATRVAEGRGATWFDNHTLLVDVDGGPLDLS